MRKWALLLSFVAGSLAFATAAGATPPAPASGSETFTSLTSTLLRVADGTSFFANSATGTITGTISGTWTAEFRTAVRPSGEFVASQGTFVCTCSIAGRSGTFTTRFEGKGAVAPIPTLSVRFETIAATGGLDGLHLNGTGEQIGATVTYSATYHFDPEAASPG
jgi:hypothetical protein